MQIQACKILDSEETKKEEVRERNSASRSCDSRQGEEGNSWEKEWGTVQNSQPAWLGLFIVPQSSGLLIPAWQLCLLASCFGCSSFIFNPRGQVAAHKHGFWPGGSSPSEQSRIPFYYADVEEHGTERSLVFSPSPSCSFPVPLIIKCRSVLVSALQLHPLLVLLEQSLLSSSKMHETGKRGRGLLLQRDLKSQAVLCSSLILDICGNYLLVLLAPSGFC